MCETTHGRREGKTSINPTTASQPPPFLHVIPRPSPLPHGDPVSTVISVNQCHIVLSPRFRGQRNSRSRLLHSLVRSSKASFSGTHAGRTKELRTRNETVVWIAQILFQEEHQCQSSWIVRCVWTVAVALDLAPPVPVACSPSTRIKQNFAAVHPFSLHVLFLPPSYTASVCVSV